MAALSNKDDLLLKKKFELAERNVQRKIELEAGAEVQA